jgi:hypothetical protein
VDFVHQFCLQDVPKEDRRAPWAALNRMTGLPEGADRTLGDAHLHGKMLRI